MAASGQGGLLSTLDIPPDSDPSRNLLASTAGTLIKTGIAPAPETTRAHLDQSLLSGAEHFHALVECARARQRARRHRMADLDGHDALAFVWAILSGADDDGTDDDQGQGRGQRGGHGGKGPEELRPWGATDRLIRIAKEQARGGDTEIGPQDPRPWNDTDRLIRLAEEQARDGPGEIRPPVPCDATSAQQRSLAEAQALATYTQREPISRGKGKRNPSRYASHYWPDEALDHENAVTVTYAQPRPYHLASPNIAQLPTPSLAAASTSSNVKTGRRATSSPRKVEQISLDIDRIPKKEVARKRRSTESPYFLLPSRTRPPPGTISCVPFPRLDAPRFGLIQEEVAHEPFWLLIAITFLIKTSGKLAVPAFWRVKRRFPTPLDLLDPRNQAELLDMIRHLGLPQVRLGYIYKYARGFLERPPASGVRYRVRNYDQRDMSPLSLEEEEAGEGDGEGEEEGESEEGRGARGGGGGGERKGEKSGTGDLEAWEIGHLTQGKYAIDSWRIFCRDELLGRGGDRKAGVGDMDAGGRGGEGGCFQPEWMRTRPDDKELRAYMRWMWMREGWEWDAETGERCVLREEMRRAVNEGRVEYDERGGLRILDIGFLS